MSRWGGTEESELDTRNQQRSVQLASKMSLLRSVALDLETEAHHHNRLLDGLSHDFVSGEGLLLGSLNRVRALIPAGRQNRKIMCYMAGFVVFFIWFLSYFYSKVSPGSEI
ncbi:unnamed protein product [Meganyctiphanes norvegica]|uniref:BET1-like protein n=1 Tax=Meganyctiphanes norvegica TaxID=48144 RepID=A0AAV2R641_MEGNR